MQNPYGRQLGQYTLDRLIGKGAMGEVYLGNQENLQRQVAIKLMKFVSDEALRRFNQEVAITATLDHPNIIKIYDYGIENTIPFVVMQYLTGGTLSERIFHARTSGLPLVSAGEAAQLVEKLASAIDYAHQQGVIHRDIKPGNVMFDIHGFPYLVDFGIARLNVGGQDLTLAGMTVGTPYYMAPEMWGPGELTKHVDQYAMAVLLYEMLTGRHPYEVDEGKEPNLNLMYKHLNEIPPPIETLRYDLPAQLTLVLRRALAKRPQDRYPTMTDFAQAFSDAAKHRPGTHANFFTFKLPEKVMDKPADSSGGLASRIVAISNRSKAGYGMGSQSGYGSQGGMGSRGGIGSQSGYGMPQSAPKSANRAPLIAVAVILTVLVIGGLILLLSGGGGDETPITVADNPTNTPNDIAVVTDESTSTQTAPPTATLSDVVMQLFRESTQTAEALTNPAPIETATEEITATEDATATEELTPEIIETAIVSPTATLNEFAMQLFGTQTAEAQSSEPTADITIAVDVTAEETPDRPSTINTVETTPEETEISEVQQQQTLDAIVQATLDGNLTATLNAIASATAEQIAIDQTATANIPTETPTPTATETEMASPTPKPTRTFTPSPTSAPTETFTPTYTPSPTATVTPNETDIAATITQAYIDTLPTNTPTITPTATPDSWSISETTTTVRGWAPPRVVLSLLFVPMECFTVGDVEQCLPAPFEVDANLITNAQYAQCVNGGACLRPVLTTLYDPTGERANEPVVGVTWFMAQTYCTARGGRLLTEREWLFIAENKPDFGAIAREWLATIAQDYEFAPYNADDGREDMTGIIQGTVISMVTRGGVEGNRRFEARGTLDTNQNNDNLGFRCVYIP